MHLRATFIAVLAILLGLAGPAGAQEVNAPPGNSAVDEYLETVPGATGNQPTNRSTDRSALPAAERRALERQGADGRAAADLAESAGPQAARTDAAQPSGTAALPRADSGGVVDPLRRAASGSEEGMGLWLPILLALGAIGAVAAVLWRRRATEQ